MVLSSFRRIFIYVFLSVYFIASLSAQVSQIGDFSKIKADNYTEAQLKEFIHKYESNGYTIEQVAQTAIQDGMPIDEWNKLQNRITALKSGKQDGEVDNLMRTIGGERSLAPTSNEGYRLNIFGSSLFNRHELTFEPNLRLPTPEDYQLGPGDELIIDIYGLAENAYKLTVSPEGYVRIPRIGLLQVSGLSIEQARKSISKQLSIIYTTIQSKETFVSVTLGNIRSISVMLIGEVYRPGTYMLPSVASIFNALNVAGGPNDNGSFRSIKLIRNNKTIAKIDVYDFLLTGELKNNLRLQDQDIIKIDPYDKRIELEGEVKNTGIFEAIDGETLSDLITYAGGFTNNAYKDRITVHRNTDKERSVADVMRRQFSEFSLQNGDHFIVGRILNRYLNRVQIAGAVYRPGIYALEQGMTVKSLIDKADGVKDDAFLNRAIIFRERSNKTKELLSINIEKLLNGESQDIQLQREDSIFIASVNNMKEGQSVSIWGEVLNNGTYDFRENMTLKDLVFIAGGLKDKAELREVEVSRLIKDADLLKSSNERTINFKFSLNRDLKIDDNKEFVLEPFDQVIVRPISGYEGAKKVTIMGEVNYPGSYIITSKNEKISDILSRAGGLNQFAYPDGAFLIRSKKTTSIERKLEETVFSGISQGIGAKVERDDFFNNEGVVGIELMKVIQKPGSKWDLILEEGDVINVPRQLQTVQVSGEIFLPVHVRYDESMSFTDYIDNAGGFSSKALKRKAFVVHPNGSARSTKSFLFFRKYPEVKPGSLIFIPSKSENTGQKMSTAETISIATSTTSLAAILMSMFKTVF